MIAAADTTGRFDDDPADQRTQQRQQIQEQIRDSALFDVPYVIMNVLATIVACYGLLENSSAVVIGAMLIAQLIGPISGIALALVTGDTRLLLRSLGAELGGVLLVLMIAWILGRIHRDLPLGSQILSRTSPNILDLIIALAGGAAGAYATISPKIRSSLVGVAMATALVPPLAVCGVCLARGETALAWGSFLLFFANFVAIQFAFSIVLGIYGLYRTHRDERRSRYQAILRQMISVVLLVILATVLGSSFAHSVRQQREQAAIREALIRGLREYPGAQLAEITFHADGARLTVTAVVRTSGSVSPAKVAALQRKLPPQPGKVLSLQVQSVITKTATAYGYLQDSQQGQGSDGAAPAGPPSSTDTTPDVPGQIP